MNNLEKAYEICVAKTRLNIEKIGAALKEFPACADGEYFKNTAKTKEIGDIMCWTSSFFTGMALLAYEKTKDAEYIKWLNAQFEPYYAKVYKTPSETMHDLGFLYTPYSVGMYKVLGDKNAKNTAIRAAEVLAARFCADGGYIKAWGRMNGITKPSDTDPNDHFYTQSEGLFIIDCMMNLPLLFWAAKETGNPYFRKIAETHANTTMKYIARPDGSVFHAYRYIEMAGKYEPANYCGYSVDSWWARGTAWAIYGFAIAFAYTKHAPYLETAEKLSRAFISQLPENGISANDFRVPDGVKMLPDTSAAAIAACGFMEIHNQNRNSEIAAWADKILKTLSEKYINTDINIPGILSEQNGNNTYASFGDYFYMEALTRKINVSNGYW